MTSSHLEKIQTQLELEKSALTAKMQSLQEAVAHVNRLNAEVDYYKGRVSGLADLVRQFKDTDWDQ